MLKQIKFGLMAVSLLAMATSCQNANSDVRDAARESVENNVQPNNGMQDAAQSPTVAAGPTTEISFEEQRFDFGTVTEGEKVSHTFSFTNTGDEPLILSNARGSCGCTVPKWPREPIAPGKSSDIVVEFNTKNKQGQRSQKVTITANTNPPETFIYLEGQVNKADAQPDVQVNQ